MDAKTDSRILSNRQRISVALNPNLSLQTHVSKKVYAAARSWNNLCEAKRLNDVLLQWQDTVEADGGIGPGIAHALEDTRSPIRRSFGSG